MIQTALEAKTVKTNANRNRRLKELQDYALRTLAPSVYLDDNSPYSYQNSAISTKYTLSANERPQGFNTDSSDLECEFFMILITYRIWFKL